MNNRLNTLGICIISNFIGKYFCYNGKVESDNIIKLYFDNDYTTYELYIEDIGNAYYISKGDLTIKVSDNSKVIHAIHSALEILENSCGVYSDSELESVFYNSIKRLSDE